MKKIALLALFAGVVALAYTQKDTVVDTIDSSSSDFNKYDTQLRSAAQKYGVADWLILKAITWNESICGTYRSVAYGIRNPADIEGSKSDDGLSWGIAQFTLDTANWLRPGTTAEDLNNPEISIDLLGKYMAYLIKRENGDLKKAVEAYNEGPGNVDKGKPDEDYWSKFQRHYVALQNQA